MPIDPISEQLISLNDAAKLFPKNTRGKHPHISCLYRHTKSGCRGVVLESIQAGSVRSTSREAVARFFERLTEQTVLAAQRAPKPSDVEAVKAGQLLDKTLFKSRRNPNGRGEGGQSK